MQNKDIRDAHKKQEKEAASVDPMKSGTVKTYTVKAGDTLSKIAEKIYGDPEAYQKIYEANKEAIGPNPDLIKEGLELTIPPK